MSDSSERTLEQEQELRRRFGSGDDKSIPEGKAGKFANQDDNLNLSPVDSENEQKFGSDSDHVSIYLFY